MTDEWTVEESLAAFAALKGWPSTAEQYVVFRDSVADETRQLREQLAAEQARGAGLAEALDSMIDWAQLFNGESWYGQKSDVAIAYAADLDRARAALAAERAGLKPREG